MNDPTHALRLRLVCCVLALLASSTGIKAQAHTQASEASAMSMLPVAMLSAAPLTLLGAGVNLTVVSAQASIDGTMWVLERASDGVRATLKLAGQSALAVGTSVAVTAMAAGWVLSAAGKAIAFVPNEMSAGMLFNERITP